ncbi:hypothetical protein COY05_00625 [Candidatus Peregrinibacteria bacterium CG_4_10_14_0_2_um_filter_38_24]|nr:MAG: hypothetical protein COY05_00625 [Candidatus Peregrinibacteria bacterium CG_4_10_14_0_2_um_filter_38_24]PJC39157.1 MAG: hypothetical protein CO044_01270 [Candidatus Peregrinibacteria bacterium CG_4_9_14_0_2_um_filter_38_9]
MNYKYHLIINFPKDYPWYKKVYANVLFFFSGMIIHPRDNWLTQADLRGAHKLLKKGDVVFASHNLEFDRGTEKKSKGKVLLYDDEKELEAQEFMC